MTWEEEEWQTHGQLDVHDLERMDGGDREGSRLLVLVVELVEMLVEPRSVVQTMKDIRRVVLKTKIK